MQDLIIPLEYVRWALRYRGMVTVEERDAETCQVWLYPRS